MPKRNRSISYKLDKQHKAEKKAELLHEWLDKWHCEHIDIIERMKKAIDTGNIDELRISFAELRAVTNKKHSALHNIFDHLLKLDNQGEENV